MAKNFGALASLTAQYNDSDIESDEEIDDDHSLSNSKIIKSFINPQVPDSFNPSRSNSPYNLLGTIDSMRRPINQELVDKITELDEKIEIDPNEITCNEEEEERPISPMSFHKKLLHIPLDEIKIPPEPSSCPPVSLVEKISLLHKKMREGTDMKALMEKRKDFRNPSIYEKLIAYCGIDELGTNLPPEVYDPHKWGPESFYDELFKKQKIEMDRREKERKERTKVEFVTGTAKKGESNEPKRKSKWDVGSNNNIGTLSGDNGIENRVLARPVSGRPSKPVTVLDSHSGSGVGV